VLLALAPNQLSPQVLDRRPLKLAASDLKLEGDQVLALEEVIQRRWGESVIRN
jgi:hypothetical protein